MKKIFYLFCFFPLLLNAQTTIVTASGLTFTPADITITVGETVQWDNVSGSHNVNGNQATYPGNPESFYSGFPANAPWSFSHTFNTVGFYNYRCDIHGGMGMTGTITVESPTLTNALLIAGVYDAQPGAAGAKGIELYALEDISDLSNFGLGSANNGDGSDGEEFTFPAVSVTAGQCFYVSDDSTKFADFFGFDADFIEGSATAINGDDAIELFESGIVIDVFGDINMSGGGEPWEYTDGWAYRNDATGPDGSTFVLGNWSFSGVDGLQGGDTNAEAPVPFPNCTYSEVPPMFIQANDDSASGEINQTLNIDVLANDDLPNGFESVEIHEDPANGSATVVMANGSIDYEPDLDFCGDDSFSYIVCDVSDCDTATVSVNIICPTSYPQYSIGEVTTVNANGVADSLGVTCEITGIVYGVNLRPPNGLQFTIIDEINADDGIGLFSGAENWGYTVDEGDEVVVRGTIEQFNGLTQINPDTVWEVSSGNALHDPEVVTDMSEDTESKLIRFENMTFIEDLDTVWTGSGAGFNVKISDGTNTFIMRIDNDVDLYSMPAPTFTTFNVTGLGGQFDPSSPFTEGYQLLPRYMEDLEEVVSVVDPEIGTNVEFFPNPVADVLNIRTTIPIDFIQITNVLGQKVAQVYKPENREELNVSHLSPGIYAITFVSENRIWTAEFVKQ
jgi:plastocyanin